jgi:hypothetical protein
MYSVQINKLKLSEYFVTVLKKIWHPFRREITETLTRPSSPSVRFVTMQVSPSQNIPPTSLRIYPAPLE